MSAKVSLIITKNKLPITIVRLRWWIIALCFILKGEIFKGRQYKDRRWHLLPQQNSIGGTLVKRISWVVCKNKPIVLLQSEHWDIHVHNPRIAKPQ